VNNCGECRQPLEEWEAGICEGCGLLTGAKNGQKNG
jgi:predicted amidophosphoribosyltransferase